MRNFHDGEKEMKLDILMDLRVFSPTDYEKVIFLVSRFYVSVLPICASLTPKVGRIDFINNLYNIEFIHARSVPEECKNFSLKNKGPSDSSKIQNDDFLEKGSNKYN